MFAGTWYPKDKSTLSAMIDNFFEKSEKRQPVGKVKGVIVPHAGYTFSGSVAAEAFSVLDPADYDTVIILGPSHRYPLSKASILNVTHYKTPLGEIKLSEKRKKLLESDIINTIPKAHEQEHSIEIELPFLQKAIADFEIIPILVGQLDYNKLVKAISGIIDDRTLIVVSVDLSHYHPYDEAVKMDTSCIEGITSMDISILDRCEIDAPWAVATLMGIAQEKEWGNELRMYKNSGDVTNDKSKGVVGYSAIVFFEEQGINTNGRSFLLELARETLNHHYEEGTYPLLEKGMLASSLLEKKGCFVTLKKDHNLRGCIGHIIPQEPLYKCVIENSLNAALHDTRFQPVNGDELDDISIEISVLTVPEEIEYSSGEDLLEKIVPFKDGIILKSGLHQSTYLPTVWDQIPDKEKFLTNLCIKGGMSSDCWNHPAKTKVLRYRAQVFSEK